LKNGLNKFFPMFMCAIPRKYIHSEYGEMGVKVMWIFISVKLSKCFPRRVYPTTALSHTKLNYGPQGPIEHQCMDGIKSYIHTYSSIIYRNTNTAIIIIIFLCTYTFLDYQVSVKQLTTRSDARSSINLHQQIRT